MKNVNIFNWFSITEKIPRETRPWSSFSVEVGDESPFFIGRMNLHRCILSSKMDLTNSQMFCVCLIYASGMNIT